MFTIIDILRKQTTVLPYRDSQHALTSYRASSTITSIPVDRVHYTNRGRMIVESQDMHHQRESQVSELAAQSHVQRIPAVRRSDR